MCTSSAACSGAHTEFTTPCGDVELPKQTISIPYTLQPGTINIVALALHMRFNPSGTRQKLKTWEPAGLVGAWYEA
jgi:hypothetical protein